MFLKKTATTRRPSASSSRKTESNPRSDSPTGRIREEHKKEFQNAQRADKEKKAEKQEEEKCRHAEEEAKAESLKAEAETRRKKREALPQEPSESDPAACEIAFRLPSGKRLTRRFLRTSRIQVRCSRLTGR